MDMQLHKTASNVSASQLIPAPAPSADVKTVVVAPDARDAMASGFADLPDPYVDGLRFAASVFPGLWRIGEAVVAEVFHFAVGPDAPAALFIDGLPTDATLPPTPADGEPAARRESYVGEAVTIGLARLLGEPVGYATEKSGRILHNLVPVRGAEQTQSNRSSSVFLSFHNDSVYDESEYFHVYNPDFLVLYGHRADPAGHAKTLYISARTIIENLAAADLEILRQPLFRMAAPSNYTNLLRNGEKVWSRPMPIIFGPETLPEIAVGANGVSPLTPQAESAFARLQVLCQRADLHSAVTIGSGQALLVNNRKGLHARTPFVATYGANERWLLRANVRRDVWSMRSRWTGAGLVFN